VSQRVEADVRTYPDSGKRGAVAGRAWDGRAAAPSVTFTNRYARDGGEVDYWIGE
jgi:hypothetical protein